RLQRTPAFHLISVKPKNHDGRSSADWIRLSEGEGPSVRVPRARDLRTIRRRQALCLTDTIDALPEEIADTAVTTVGLKRNPKAIGRPDRSVILSGIDG